MSRVPMVHFDTRPIVPADFEPGAKLPEPLAVACGARTAQNATTVAAEVTCGNCKRRMPKPVELVDFVATFHENPNIAACPECLPAVAEILDANPDVDPAELELPPCAFCDGMRLVYVQSNAPSESPASENSP